MTHKDFFLNLPSFIETASPRHYEENSLGIIRRVPGAVKPKDGSEIKQILRVAAATKVRIHPLSAGKNWGYGSALSPDKDAIIMDLSRLDTISFNKIDETFSIGPGVTQGLLHKFLIKNDLPYLVPVTGAGPNASVLANALERGYGITPIEEHFSAVTGLRAIMPDGSDYQPIMTEKTGRQIWKWDIGPFIQGLFCQSTIGVVTELTLRLYKKPEVVAVFRAISNDLKKLVITAKAAREIEAVKGINIMNRHRVASMAGPNDDKGEWTLMGSFYCQRELAPAVKRCLKRIFRQSGVRVQIIDNRSFSRIKPLLRFINGSKTKFLQEAFNILLGIPSQLALNLAGGEANVDKRGLIWYSPIIPNDWNTVLSAAKMIEGACRRHSISPSITFTLVSPYVFSATIPIVFSKKEDLSEAWNCYDDLLDCGINLGIAPYRYPVGRQEIVEGTAADRINKLIKHALDPLQILSNGRYVSTK